MILSNLQWQIMPGMFAQVNQVVSQSKRKNVDKASTSKPSRLMSSLNSLPMTGTLMVRYIIPLGSRSSTVTRDRICMVLFICPYIEFWHNGWRSGLHRVPYSMHIVHSNAYKAIQNILLENWLL